MCYDCLIKAVTLYEKLLNDQLNKDLCKAIDKMSNNEESMSKFIKEILSDEISE